MTRDCLRCGFTFPLEDFAAHGPAPGRLHVCPDCQPANVVVLRVAGIAADGIIRLRAIDALLGLGYIRTARLIACGLANWPSIRELRGSTLIPRQRCAGVVA